MTRALSKPRPAGIASTTARAVAEEDQADAIVARVEGVDERPGRVADVRPAPADRARHVHDERQVDHAACGLAEGIDAQLLEVRQLHERRRHNRGGADVDDVDAGDRVRRHREEAGLAWPRRRRSSHPTIREVGVVDVGRFLRRAAAVQHARGAERGAVNCLRQLRLHDVSAPGVDREADEYQEHREKDGHVEQGEAPFVMKCVSLSGHVRSAFERSGNAGRACAWTR